MSSDETRTRFLDAALRLFAEHGYAGTSTRMLASEAGSNVASLAYHFGGKEGLYRAALLRLHEDLGEATPAAIPIGAPAEIIEQIVGLAWSFARDHRDHIRLLIRNVLDRGQHVEGVTDQSAPLLARADAIVGLLRPDLSSTRRRMLIMGVMHTVARLAIEHPDDLGVMVGEPEDLDAEIRAFLVDLVRRQLGLPE
ncbi:MAG: TetR/AcrR family transcriptional regulator [Deltaproteobacteria bacterium]|nr:MAG: TetR/AcrR family transcriptional regulator [Deltaproteobacteria bacterium]